jgi:putative transposase
MARLARVVLPGVAHHVTQRGNRRLPLFFSDADRTLYCELLAAGCSRAHVTCLAWCLMDNHVHLILVPRTADGLRGALGEAHPRSIRHINFREGWRGHLFQARFASYPMDGAHLLAAIRHVENNPVAAGLVREAGDWAWSSARSHPAGRRMDADVLTDASGVAPMVRNWRAMLRHGWEAGDLGEIPGTAKFRGHNTYLTRGQASSGVGRWRGLRAWWFRAFPSCRAARQPAPADLLRRGGLCCPSRSAGGALGALGAEPRSVAPYLHPVFREHVEELDREPCPEGPAHAATRYL